MKKAKQCLIALLPGVLLTITVLSGCGQSQKAVSKNDDHLTVYLWENRLMKNIVPYIHEQFPDQDIEFITGNNDTDLYSYFEEHGELPRSFLLGLKQRKNQLSRILFSRFSQTDDFFPPVCRIDFHFDISCFRF